MVECPKCSAQNPQGSRFCNSCGHAFTSLSQMPTAEGPVVETPHVARIISSDSIPVGGFTPGTILADRYRIIGLLGRGGMGEVYRADDLKLGQPVALKFLPPKLAEDSVRRERFFAEVRITRQLSHPNICRVYDIQEIDGRHFLSMEYIDGEDLASLIKRIGHLTNEKALDIARQLAAGLAAAHERGVLHRDLKPANIMLDGHGRVRITDFGLAIAAEDEAQAAEIAGTPAYMAPEQLAGKGATVRSDMYSLGLVLYEIYTGKKAFTATTLAELREQKETHTPRAISEIREGMDPVVERLIRRCMERDPNARPSSVAQLALALPGGDPLAAALAAGETPSPEMVAASGGKEGLRPAFAWGLLALIFVGSLALLAMNDRFMLHRRIPFKKSPDALIERSREIVKKAGYSEESADSAYGFMQHAGLLNYIEKSDKTANRWKSLDAKAILFWYRQSPRRFEAQMGNIASDYPPMQISGEVLISLDTEGHLVSFRAVPPLERSSAEFAKALDWTDFFTEAGLNKSQWTVADPQWRPPEYADTGAAWQGLLSNQPGIAVRIEAAAYQGKPVSFEIIGPWTRAAPMEPSRPLMWQRVQNLVAILLLVTVIGGAVFFARRNLRLGRGDRRNATRLALFFLALNVLSLILRVPHGSFNALEIPYMAGLLWIFYIALEPFVRRRWPQILVSWTRLLSRDWRDPFVARDALVGCAVGVLINCILRFSYYILPSWLGYPYVTRLLGFNFETIMGTRLFSSVFLSSLGAVIALNIFLLFFLFLMRILQASPKAAIVAFILFGANFFGPKNLWGFATWVVLLALYLFLLMRFGLVAGAFSYFVNRIFSEFPATLDTSAWYFGYGFAAVAIFAVIVLYAFRFSLGGRPLLAPSHLDD
jgi:predicted Ser/Thr protein kinase